MTFCESCRRTSREYRFVDEHGPTLRRRCPHPITVSHTGERSVCGGRLQVRNAGTGRWMQFSNRLKKIISGWNDNWGTQPGSFQS